VVVVVVAAVVAVAEGGGDEDWGVTDASSCELKNHAT
jgi:hypothetical protein